ncbi:hypothetical protein AAC387_Pa07g0069 [Persea americana]
MKGMKGEFLRKLKSIGHIGQVLNVPDSGQVFKAPPVHIAAQPEPDIIDISKLLKALGEEDEKIEHHIGTIDKENIRPPGDPVFNIHT